MIETQAQHDFLREHECDEMQGYHFAGPLTGHQFRLDKKP